MSGKLFLICGLLCTIEKINFKYGPPKIEPKHKRIFFAKFKKNID